MGIQKERSDQMREKIIYSALKLLSEKDLDAITVAEIAEGAGCSPGNIYHYFSSKEAIVAASTDSLDEQYLAAEQSVQNDKRKLSPFEKLKEFQKKFYQAISHMTLNKYYYIYGFKNIGNDVIRLDEHRASQKIYRRLLNACIDSGEIRKDLDIEEVIRDINVINRGVVVEWLFDDKKSDVVEMGVHVSYIFFDGLR